MKTPMSRFQIHDDLTAPEGSVAGAARRAGLRRAAAELPGRARGLAGGAARLRAVSLRASPRQADAGRRSSGSRSRSPSTTTPSPGSRCTRGPRAAAGLALDEVALARQFTSKDEREAALLRYLQALLEDGGRPPMHLHEEAREAGWDDEQILEAIAAVALEGVHRDGQRRRRGSGRRLERGVAGARGGVSSREHHGCREHTASGRWRDPGRKLLPALSRGGRARRATLDRRDPAGPDGRAAALLGGRPGGPRALRPPPVRAHEGARGARASSSAR